MPKGKNCELNILILSQGFAMEALNKYLELITISYLAIVVSRYS